MHETVKNGSLEETANTAARCFALFVCAAIIVAICFASAFVVEYGGHKHGANAPEAGCAVCLRIAAAQNQIKQLSMGFAALCVLFAFRGAFAFCANIFTLFVPQPNLTTLKVKLNN